jgi:hypothetical protein
MLLALLLMACETEVPKPEQDIKANELEYAGFNVAKPYNDTWTQVQLHKWVDRELGVACYSRDSSSVSCVSIP